MGDERQHEHIREAFLTMRKGEVAWIQIGPKYHNDIYHKFCKKDHLKADTVLGPNIYIKLAIDSIKRLPPYLDN
jgi:hypothetical protein